MKIYVVQDQDTLQGIAASQEVSQDSIQFINQLRDADRLVPGQALLLPSPGEMIPEYLGTCMGYAYPFISSQVLEQSLPFLTSLHVFSYGFNLQGDLIFPEVEDEWVIRACLEAGTRPVLTFTSIGEDGRFHSQLIHVLLNTPSLQQKVIWQLGQVMQGKGFAGIDIDFEYIPGEDRQAFSDFLLLVRRVLGAFGYQVSVALAPKSARDQKGLLYEGVDYQSLGQAADQVMLMTYEWGYTYGPPMAVAPLHQVRRVAEYALTEIRGDKIILGIPNYGYDWPLPYVRGVTKAATLGNVEAVELAAEKGARIYFDSLSQSPYFTYTSEGVEHQVWFEDVRSYQAKFQLIQELGLRGPGWWQMMRLFRAGLLLMADTFLIRKESEEILQTYR